MTKKPPRKPSGKTGPVEVTGQDLKWHEFKVPETKKEAEALVADLFARCLPDGEKGVVGIIGMSPKETIEQLEENHHDFRLSGSNQEWIVQITELIPVDEFRGDYENAPKRYSNGEMADRFVGRVLEKSEHYGVAGTNEKQRLVLIVYISEAKFLLGQNTTFLIRHSLRNENHIFDRVYFMPIVDGNTAFPELIYPGPPIELSKVQIREMRENQFVNFTYQDMKPIPGGVEMTVDLVKGDDKDR